MRPSGGDTVRVAVIGSGPAGIYTAQALTNPGVADGRVTVDVFDRLPVPYGLVRYGVAPDHPKIKSIIAQLAKVMERDSVRFLGNIQLGVDVTLDQLRAYYDAVVVSSGASAARDLAVPGEGLTGSISANEFVSWYSGHPDTRVDHITLTARSVAVVGAGNVALDVARMLLAPVESLRRTDVPDHVLDVLAASPVREVSVLARRGVAYAKFSSKELLEMTEVPGLDLVVRADEVAVSDAEAAGLAGDPVRRRSVEVLQSWTDRPSAGHRRRLSFRFLTRPTALLGQDRVETLEIARAAVDHDGRVGDSGEVERLDVQMVVRSVGYRGLPTAGLPFDPGRGVIPNLAGAVTRDGERVPGMYVAGWIKRGPTGVIATNRKDAIETVDTLLADLPELPAAPHRDTDDLLTTLRDRDVQVVDWAGWAEVDAAENVRGGANGRSRVKIHAWDELLKVSAGVLYDDAAR